MTRKASTVGRLILVLGLGAAGLGLLTWGATALGGGIGARVFSALPMGLRRASEVAALGALSAIAVGFGLLASALACAANGRSD